MSKILDFVKKHPVGVAVGAAGLVGSYILLSGGSGTATTTDDTASIANAEAAEVQAGQQYQVAQLQANQAALVSNNQAAVANNQITGDEVIAQLQSQDTLAQTAATATTQQNADTLSAQTTQAVSLLQAQVAENQTAAQVQTATINANAYVSIANAPYQSADYIAGLEEQLDAASLPSNAALTSLQSQIAALTTGQNQIGQDLQAAFTLNVPMATPLYNLPGANGNPSSQQVGG